jgi:hypothetical protein
MRRARSALWGAVPNTGRASTRRAADREGALWSSEGASRPSSPVAAVYPMAVAPQCVSLTNPKYRAAAG